MNLLIGSLSYGLIMSLLAYGVYISFRLFDVPDITVDGSVTLGAATTATLLLAGWNPILATIAGTLAASLAGATAGLLQTKCGINPLLAGILVMTGLYSINLRIMGKRSNVSLFNANTHGYYGLNGVADDLGKRWNGGEFVLMGWPVNTGEVIVCAGFAVVVIVVGLLLFWFFNTDIGTAMRASGDNPQMVRALGVNVEACRILGLALSNGMVGLCGSLWCQAQGFADVQMGIGMVVWGLASVIIGEAVTGGGCLAFAIAGATMGSVIFRLLVAIALRMGLDTNDFKLVTAVCVFVALTAPKMIAKLKRARPVPAT